MSIKLMKDWDVNQSSRDEQSQFILDFGAPLALSRTLVSNVGGDAAVLCETLVSQYVAFNDAKDEFVVDEYRLNISDYCKRFKVSDRSFDLSYLILDSYGLFNSSARFKDNLFVDINGEVYKALKYVPQKENLYDVILNEMLQDNEEETNE